MIYVQIAEHGNLYLSKIFKIIIRPTFYENNKNRILFLTHQHAEIKL